MAVKRTVREKCPACGQTDATYDEATRTVNLHTHRCTEPVPGPANPPRRFRLSEVIFEHADGRRITEHGGEVIAVA